MNKRNGRFILFSFWNLSICLMILWPFFGWKQKPNKFKEEKKNIGITYVSKFTETCSKIETKSELRKKRIMKKKKLIKLKKTKLKLNLHGMIQSKNMFFALEWKKLSTKEEEKKAENKLARSQTEQCFFFPSLKLSICLIESPNSHKPLKTHRNISTSMLTRSADSSIKMERHTVAHCIWPNGWKDNSMNR